MTNSMGWSEIAYLTRCDPQKGDSSAYEAAEPGISNRLLGSAGFIMK